MHVRFGASIVMVATFGLALVQPAGAALMSEVFNADTSSAADDFDVDGYNPLPFENQGRIGDQDGTAEWELNVGENSTDSDAFSQANRSWPNDDPESFSLNFDGTTATASVGDDTVSYSGFGDLSGMNSLLIRTATPGEGTAVRFTDLTLDGKTVGTDGTYSNVYDDDAEETNRLVQWLGIYGAGDLSDSFTLEGKVALAWSGDAPGGSNLAFQVKGAEGPQAVPAPATLAMLGAGLLGLGAVARTRRHMQS